MAEVLDDFPTPLGKRGVSKYAKWMDGQIWRINHEEEMGLPNLESARAALHSGAQVLGMRVRTRADGDDHIIIQAYKEDFYKEDT